MLSDEEELEAARIKFYWPAKNLGLSAEAMVKRRVQMLGQNHVFIYNLFKKHNNLGFLIYLRISLKACFLL
jgi:hypothetical protein